MKRPKRVEKLEELKNPMKGLTSLVEKNTKIMIFGTFPGKESRDNQEYYFDKSNRFWDVIGQIFNYHNLKYQSYNIKQSILLKNSIGLWDLINYAETMGSQDKDIKKALYNDLNSFLDYRSSVKIVLFNGLFTGELALLEMPAIFGKGILFKSLQSTSRKNGHFNNGEDWKGFFKSLEL